MQLSNSPVSPDSNLAALLLPAAPKSGADAAMATSLEALGAPLAGDGVAGFAELFPDLAATGTAPVEKIVAPTGDGPAIFPFGATPANIATNSPQNLTAPVNPAVHSVALRPVEFPAAEDPAASVPLAEPTSATATVPATPVKPANGVPSVPRRVASVVGRAEPEASTSAIATISQFPMVTSNAQPPPVPEPVSASDVETNGESPAAPPLAVAPGATWRGFSPTGGEPKVSNASAKVAFVDEDAVTNEARAPITNRIEQPASRSVPASAPILTTSNSQPSTLKSSFTSASLPPLEGVGAPPPTTEAKSELLPVAAAPLAQAPDALPADTNVQTNVIASAGFQPPPTNSRAEIRSTPSAEKFADAAEVFGGEKISLPNAPEKTFLSTSGKRVASREANLGTAVANSAPAMSTSAFANRPPSVVTLERAPAIVPPAAETSPNTSVAAPLAPIPTTAHRAVEAVLTAVEQFSAGDRHAVNLQFSVGGADLSVRVELRADEVRATFRTDSPELRAALATEWSAATPNVGDRSLRLAAPVFTANDNANLAAFSGDTTPRERDSRARRSNEEFSTVVASRARGTAALAQAPTGFLPRVPSFGNAGKSLHLSTLA